MFVIRTLLFGSYSIIIHDVFFYSPPRSLSASAAGLECRLRFLLRQAIETEDEHSLPCADGRERVRRQSGTFVLAFSYLPFVSE